MKTLRLFIFIALISTFTFAQNSEEKIATGVTLKVKIDNVRNEEGHVLFSLHTEETFMKAPGIQNAAVVIENGTAHAIFENVTPGSYAILALHDKNNNNRMDFEPNGMPKEDYGATNNVMVMGPPTYTDAEFTVENVDLELSIRF
ncbi:DUF2141 domain-containing protein [Ascidiimonas sp. W6]|uniref:DUF2141 domain-containing protein n=1 Tax=Ascidiimonas meishanensis TaxID=3128903 RepID=UPI0030EBD4B3